MYGTGKSIFSPNIDYTPTFDSHTSLSKVDQRKVNAILERNTGTLYRYAVKQLGPQAYQAMYSTQQDETLQDGMSRYDVGQPEEGGCNILELQDSLQSSVYDAQPDGTFKEKSPSIHCPSL